MPCCARCALCLRSKSMPPAARARLPACWEVPDCSLTVFPSPTAYPIHPPLLTTSKPYTPPPPTKQVTDPYKEHRVKLGGLVEYVDAIRSGRRIMFVACGTSYHACLAARYSHLLVFPVGYCSLEQPVMFVSCGTAYHACLAARYPLMLLCYASPSASLILLGLVAKRCIWPI